MSTSPDGTKKPQDQRKLVAILYADMHGYSRLIGLDDGGTLARLRSLRQDVIDPAIEEHSGKLVQTGGDSLLIVFDSIDGAVRCALKVQQLVPIRDNEAPERTIRFRMGINIGDAIADGTDLHGEAVNVAARLQAECPPGGICVSRSVRDHVHGRLGLEFEELGALKLKNIARPIEAFVAHPTADKMDQVTRPMLQRQVLQLDLQQLHVLYKVKTLGGIAEAADQLGIPLASVGGQLQELERRCGITLFRFSAADVTLTDAGQLAFEHAARIFSQADELHSALQDLPCVPIGKLTVGGSLTAGEFFLPHVAGRFNTSHPKVTLSILLDNSTTVLSMIRRADLDLGFVGTDAIPHDLNATPCWDDEIVVIAAAGSVAGVQPIHTIEEQKFIMREDGSATRQHIEQSLRRRGLSPRTAMTVGSPEAVKRYVAARLGWGFASRQSVATEVAAGQLAIVNVDGWDCSRTFYAVFRRGHRLSGAQSAFVEQARTLDL